MQGFAEFDPAAGQRVEALAGRAGAAHQQHLAVTKDRGADCQLRPWGYLAHQWVMI
jgi:hypothetical protein